MRGEQEWSFLRNVWSVPYIWPVQVRHGISETLIQSPVRDTLERGMTGKRLTVFNYKNQLTLYNDLLCIHCIS